MRAIVVALAVFIASASFALADDVMANFYGNTLVASSATNDLRIHYRADHTFDAVGTNAGGPVAFHGKWSIDKEGRLCRDYDPPSPAKANKICTPWEAHEIGDTWELPGVTLTLVEGIQ